VSRTCAYEPGAQTKPSPSPNDALTLDGVGQRMETRPSGTCDWRKNFSMEPSIRKVPVERLQPLDPLGFWNRCTLGADGSSRRRIRASRYVVTVTKYPGLTDHVAQDAYQEPSPDKCRHRLSMRSSRHRGHSVVFLGRKEGMVALMPTASRPAPARVPSSYAHMNRALDVAPRRHRHDISVATWSARESTVYATSRCEYDSSIVRPLGWPECSRTQPEPAASAAELK
jgi:hypothetical protein